MKTRSKFHKLTACLLAVVMLMSMLTACGGGGGGGGSKGSSSSVDSTIAVKLGASSSIKNNDNLNELAQLAFHASELAAEKLSGKDIEEEEKQLAKDVESAQYKLLYNGIMMDEIIGIIGGVGTTREEAIADLVANYPDAGKDKTYFGMAEGEITCTLFGYSETNYYVYVVFGVTTQEWADSFADANS